MATNQFSGGLSLTERKKLLIAQGAIHRAEIVQAREVVRDNLSVGTLAKKALGQAASGIFSAIRKGSSGGGLLNGETIQFLLPLAVRFISRYAKQSKGIKPIARGAALMAIAAVIARFILRMRKSRYRAQQ
jgi:hypothetical protein